MSVLADTLIRRQEQQRKVLDSVFYHLQGGALMRRDREFLLEQLVECAYTLQLPPSANLDPQGPDELDRPGRTYFLAEVRGPLRRFAESDAEYVFLLGLLAQRLTGSIASGLQGEWVRTIDH